MNHLHSFMLVICVEKENAVTVGILLQFKVFESWQLKMSK